MAILYLDGFEHYKAGNVNDTWNVQDDAWILTDPANPLVNETGYEISTEGRAGGQCLYYRNNNSSSYRLSLSKGQYGQNVGILGFALRVRGLEYVSSPWPSFGLVEISDGGFDGFAVHLNYDGTFYLREMAYIQGSFWHVMTGSTTVSIEEDRWHYFEMKWWSGYAHNTDGNTPLGRVILRLDGMTILDVTDLPDSQTFGWAPFPQWTTIHLAAQQGGSRANWISGEPEHPVELFFDDLYLCDTTGGIHDDFLGDITVKTVYVNGDGVHQDWTPSTPGTHYTLVDEDDPDDDATFVSSTTVSHSETYTFSDIDTTDTVVGVMLAVNTRKIDEGSAALESRVRHSSTDYDGYSNAFEDPFGVGGVTEYYYVHFPWDTHPNGSTWTATLVNDSEFGFIKAR